MDGQDTLFHLRGSLVQAVELSLEPDEEWLGAATLANDIRAMQQRSALYQIIYVIICDCCVFIFQG